MNLAQALEHADAFSLPGLLMDQASLDDERRKNEEAIGLLMAAWKEAKRGEEPFSFDVVRQLADRNRRLCDSYEPGYLRELPGYNLARRLSDEDLVRGKQTDPALLRDRRQVRGRGGKRPDCAEMRRG